MIRDRPSSLGRLGLLSLLCVLCGQSSAEAQEATSGIDAQRSAWARRRLVTLPAAAEGFAALPLPPDIGAHSLPDRSDLRLLGPDGAEIPYVLHLRTEQQKIERADGVLSDTTSERRVRTTWTVDLGAERRFDTVDLTIREADFAKRLSVEASDDGKSWRSLAPDASVFDKPWSPGAGRLHKTTVALPAPVQARYLRLTAQDHQTAPVVLSGAAVLLARVVPEERWTLAVAPVLLPGAPETKGEKSLNPSPGRSRYRIEVPPGLPLSALALSTDDPVFARRVSLVERSNDDESGRKVLGSELLFRVRLKDIQTDGAALTLLVDGPTGGALFLEIEDGDSPPLRNLRLTLSGTAMRLLFPISGTRSGLVLYYDNRATRAPSYDLSLLRDVLSDHNLFVTAELGAEVKNPRYQPAPPLQMTMSPGAAMALERWRYQRPLKRPPREDLYGLVLDASDLGALREDLGDLRIADSQGRQVPYVIEAGTSERRLPLRFLREATTPGKSRYRLLPEVPAGHIGFALPLLGVELEVGEGVFSRPARLFMDGGDARGGDLARVVLSRREGTLPLRLEVPAGRYRELLLEIDDGDNGPLSLRAVRGLLLLPRIAFKLLPELGDCRLFLGNPEAEPPRYDIEALRKQVLDYAALPTEAGPLRANLAYRPRAGDYVRSTSPALILWGTLLISVLALLLLTARLIKKH